jgi:integrase
MSVTVYLHKNSPYFQIEFMIDGVVYRESSKTKKKAEALRLEKKMKKDIRAEIALHPVTERADCTFSQAAQMYWNDQGENTRDADALDADIERIVLMMGGDKMCSQIRHADELRIRASLRKGERPPGIEGKGRPLKVAGMYQPSTINDYIDLVPRILNHVERVLETTFPFKPRGDKDDTNREIERVRTRYLKFEEQWKLNKVMDMHLRHMVDFDIETGMRSDELCSATWQQIDWSQYIITFNLKAKGKAPLPHEVLLTKPAMKILNARKALYAREGIDSEFIFLLPSGNTNLKEGVKRVKGELIPVGTHLLYRRFTDACEQAGVPDMIVHDLRRTAARRVYDECGIEAARVFLGHTDVRQTQDYLGVKTTEINPALLKRSARGEAALAELDAAASGSKSVATDDRTRALRLVVTERKPKQERR